MSLGHYWCDCSHACSSAPQWLLLLVVSMHAASSPAWRAQPSLRSATSRPTIAVAPRAPIRSSTRRHVKMRARFWHLFRRIFLLRAHRRIPGLQGAVYGILGTVECCSTPIRSMLSQTRNGAGCARTVRPCLTTLVMRPTSLPPGPRSPCRYFALRVAPRSQPLSSHSASTVCWAPYLLISCIAFLTLVPADETASSIACLLLALLSCCTPTFWHSRALFVPFPFMGLTCSDIATPPRIHQCLQCDRMLDAA